MSEAAENKKKIMKKIIAQLHSGTPVSEVKETFKRVLGGVGPLEIAKIEQELIKEGMPRQEIQRLCDVHLAVFREQLEKQKLEVPLGHPISILTEEHKILLQLSEKLNTIVNRIQEESNADYVADEAKQLKHIAEELLDAEKHYLREENVLFPFLEKHGITEPPAVMWIEHNKIRDTKK